MYDGTRCSACKGMGSFEVPIDEDGEEIEDDESDITPLDELRIDRATMDINEEEPDGHK